MRVVSFLLLFLSSLFAPLQVTLLFGLVYALWFPGYELLFLGAAIDAEFGITGNDMRLWYTLSFALILIAVEYIRPYLNIRFPES